MNYDDFMRKVRDLRLKNKLSQENVAQELGCTRITYAKYEEGRADISLKKALKAARLFNYKIEEIMNM